MEVSRPRLDKTADHDMIMELLNSSITNNICEGLQILKKKVVSRSDAVRFMDANRTCFLALLKLFDRLHTTLLSSTIELEDHMKTALRESSSVLANVCHFSVTACAEVSKWPRIATLLLNLLEHQAGGRMKANVLRLIGNLCKFNETSSLVAHNSALLEAIAVNIKQSDPVIVDRSIRVMRLLARNTTRLKSVLLSNCTFHIGSRILRIKSPAEVKQQRDILQILHSLVRVYPKDVGRQLVGSGCAPILLEVLFGNDDDKMEEQKRDDANPAPSKEEKMFDYLWRSFLLKLTRLSFDIREAFGRDAIKKVLSSDNLNGVKCEFLCYFTQDAWARSAMSEKKVLARMLDLLNSEECSPRQQMKIIASLKHFIYDTQSMAYLCQRGGFIRIAISHIRTFVDENTTDCEEERLKLQKKAAEDASEADANGNINENAPLSGVSRPRKRKKPSSIHLDSVSSKYEANLDRSEMDLISQEFFCGALSRASISPGNVLNPRPSTSSAGHGVWSPSMSPNSSAYESATTAFPLGTAPSVTLERTIEQDERYLFDDSIAATAASLLDSIDAPDDEDAADDETSSDSATEPAEASIATGVSTNKCKIDENALSKIEIDGRNQLDPHTKRLVVADCLEIISKLTHQEENYPYLVKDEVLRTLIDYVSDTPTFDARVMRSIMRLSRCKRSLQVLLVMNFHMMIIKKLIRRPCLLTRFGEFCRRCDRCREFGCDIIRDFARHADSNMGWYHVEMGLRNENARVLRNAFITGLTMIHGERTQRFYSIYMPIEQLLQDLARFLNGESDASDSSETCDIVMAFSSLVTQRMLRNFPDMDIKFETPTGDEKRCCLYEISQRAQEQTKIPSSDCLLSVLMQSVKDEEERSAKVKKESCDETEKIETFVFYNTADLEKGPILVVPKAQLCASNLYFQHMFMHEFMEKVEGRYKFMFDESEDLCDEADFVKFIHYLVGCRDSECVAIENGETCAALIQLSDKYLCGSLLSDLTRPGGTAHMLLNGHNLRCFVRPMLTINSVANALTNTWLFVFLRYCNNSQLLELLECIGADNMSKKWFLEALQRFLLTCANKKVDCQTSMPTAELWNI